MSDTPSTAPSTVPESAATESAASGSATARPARSAARIPPWQDCVSEADVDAAIRVFEVYSRNSEWKAHAGSFPKLRILFDLSARTLAPTGDDARAHRKRKLAERKEADRSLLAVTGIRQMRAKKLVGHASGSVDMSLPPRSLLSVAELETYANEDAAALAAAAASTSTAASVAALSAASTPAAITAASVAEPSPAAAASDEAPTNAPDTSSGNYRPLNFPRSCHICPNQFKDLHFFYDQLCPSCAEFNYAKRSFAVDMRGRVCIVTGARVKIGYCIAVKLLRMGATVIITTRFPHDAADRFAKEEDFASFNGRLFIYGIDFRDITMVHQFCRQIKSQFTRLDALINNAAQTVRKPPKFYEHLIQGETAPLPAAITSVAHVVDVYRDSSRNYVFKTIVAGDALSATASLTDATTGLALPAASALQPLSSVNTSAALSQIPLIDEDTKMADSALFPKGQLDRDDQQLDLRTENSWIMEIGQISTIEMLECHVINTFAPWILVSELKSLMESTRDLPFPSESAAPAGPDAEPFVCDKYIVNVSAMEGQFYRPKTVYHPHTNMAKAALNMMTRTSAAGLAAVNIFMTAVDTGWITDENPVQEWDKRENAPPPLDEWDAAMRCIDPILLGVLGKERYWGVFLKNYSPTRW
ncbi:hypothetical protein BC831DRAFT_449451 [Entophlyctis helioformis]|nr:hypothetical protein BC831DRAFT_449451 [Entophlyctis helioformis]